MWRPFLRMSLCLVLLCCYFLARGERCLVLARAWSHHYFPHLGLFGGDSELLQKTAPFLLDNRLCQQGFLAFSRVKINAIDRTVR